MCSRAAIGNLAAIQHGRAATVVGFPYHVYAGETDPSNHRHTHCGSNKIARH